MIVDYIFDWARDIYREAVISELRTLSGSQNPSLANDSDVFSIFDRDAIWSQELGTELDDNFNQLDDAESTGAHDVLQAFDTPYGVLRDAKYITSRFMALYITEDNLPMLIRSLKTSEESRKSAQTILEYLKNSWRVTSEALDEVERMWTGKDRENSNLFSPDKRFFAVVTLTAYLQPCWEQTRELSYLAVSEGVIEALFNHAGLDVNDGWDPSDLPPVQKHIFVSMFESFKSVKIQDTLVATFSRKCFSTKVFEGKTKRASDTRDNAELTRSVTSIERIENGVRYRFDASLKPDNQARAREFVSSIYSKYKVGRNEPSTSLLRISSRIDEQDPNTQTMDSLWNLGTMANQEKIIAVISRNPRNRAIYAEMCLFVTDTSTVEDIIEPGEKVSSECEYQFFARRLGSETGWGRGWNFRDMIFQDVNFPWRFKMFLDHLKSSLSNQGNEDQSRGPRRSWKQRKNIRDWPLATTKPMDLADIWNFRNQILLRGRRVTSVTHLIPYGEGRVADMSHPSRKGKERERISLSTLETDDTGSRITSNPIEDVGGRSGNGTQDSLESGELSRTLSTYEALGEDSTAPGKSQLVVREIGQGTSSGFGQDDSVAANPAVAFSGPSSKTTSRKRPIIIEDNDGEVVASSSRASFKRPRTDSSYNFNRDYLDEEELGRLIDEGFFT